MSKDSNIEWTDHTFNPWWGCTKVHDGCKHCYAEAMSKRVGRSKWGPAGYRVKTSPANWNEPRKWNAAAEKAGKRARVFCASMADLFEKFDGRMCSHEKFAGDEGGYCSLWYRDDIGTCTAGQTTVDRVRGERTATLDDVRREALKLIRELPWLEWLLLTKRPENIVAMCTEVWGEPSQWPTNVMFGTSPCDQATADVCIPELLKVPGRRFLSCEPLLGAIEFDKPRIPDPNDPSYSGMPLGMRFGGKPFWALAIHWVIVGGESGGGARPCNVAWIRSIVHQCEDAGVPCFVKQLGANFGWEQPPPPMLTYPGGVQKPAPPPPGCTWKTGWNRLPLRHTKGGDINEWPEEARVRQWPEVINAS